MTEFSNYAGTICLSILIGVIGIFSDLLFCFGRSDSLIPRYHKAIHSHKKRRGKTQIKSSMIEGTPSKHICEELTNLIGTMNKSMEKEMKIFTNYCGINESMTSFMGCSISDKGIH